MGIDMENAYGRVLRSSCIQATLELAPGLAALTGSQWQRPVQAWMKVGDRWVQRPTERGGWQGARLMQVLYSLTLEWRMAPGAQEWVLEAGHLPAGAKWAAPGAAGRMGYQDDQYLFGRAVDLARALPQLDACLAQDGHRVRRDKCSIWNPAVDIPEIADQVSAGDTRQALTELARETTVCKDGMDMLGSAARGELSAHVQASGIGPQAMQKRAAKGHMLVDRVITFSRESGCPERVHLAWTLLARAAAAALTYDARLPRDSLEITSRELERHICDAVDGLLGGELR